MIGKKIVVSLGIALLLVVVIFIYRLNSSGNNESGYMAYPPTKVALAKVKEVSPPRTLYGVGELEADRQVRLASETSGRVTSIEFQSGQYVEKGQLLVQINDSVEQAELVRLQAQWKNADRLYQRTSKLFANKVAAAAELDNTLAERDMALASIRQTEALIAQKAIRAPFSGVMGIRQIHIGEFLHAGNAIANLVDAKNLKLNFSLDEQASPELHIGQTVNVQVDAYPNESFPAQISAIDPLIGKSRTVQVQARLNNLDGKLKAGMYANIQVVRPNTAQVLTVPETAVTYTAYGDTVFVAQRTEQQTEQQQPMTAKRVSVEVGQRWNGMIEIKKGLTEGELVVTSGQLKLNDGAQVVAVAEDTLNTAKPSATGS
ncbi:RND efflux membrane fusion protein precursor [Xenorhabdus szentirmaii]|nr:efflux RND transporter periplasmic adaptor subunit [Xenorhabdus sp. 38]MBD2792367.1 efflux RND transporter periplasmic adaptor subunit [Xenorhabdus sp. CUL]MBD2825954.1 efflux RND transporter periplasmic adaptor subunit [Xenorhabdus sp. 5]PHM42109.1 RND efflux membrane fusion protein precursor [Xenorhabdus szentirmaii]